MNTSMTIARLCCAASLMVCLGLAGPAFAETKSIFSPIIDIDAERGFLFVSTDSGILIVKVSEAARPHVGKLPVMGMIDIVVETKKGKNVALLKSWKLVGGESSCKVFDGEKCK